MKGDLLQMRVGETELAFWTHFFLTYVRDGFGPVDHIDVETQPIDRSTTQALSVVWQVQRRGSLNFT